MNRSSYCSCSQYPPFRCSVIWAPTISAGVLLYTPAVSRSSIRCGVDPAESGEAWRPFWSRSIGRVNDETFRSSGSLLRRHLFRSHMDLLQIDEGGCLESWHTIYRPHLRILVYAKHGQARALIDHSLRLSLIFDGYREGRYSATWTLRERP